MSDDDVVRAIQALIDLDDRDRSERAAAQLPAELPISDLLRAADGAQRLARALAVVRSSEDAEEGRVALHDPHDVHSYYS